MSDDNDLQSDIAGNSPDFNDRRPKGGILGWLRGRRGGDDVYTSGRVHTGGRDGNDVRGGLSRRIGPFEYARTARGGIIQTSPDGAQILRAGGRIGGLVEGLTNLFGGGRGRDGGDSRRSDPEFRAIQEERQMRQRGETSQDRSAPRVTQRAATPQELERGELPPRQSVSADATLARLDDAQNKLNNGPLKNMDDATAVGHVTDKMKRENPGAYELYSKGGFAQSKAGLNEFFNYSREVNQNPAMRALDETFSRNPSLGSAVVDQWRKDVGADSTSPSYRGGKTTILDTIGEAAQDPDKLDMLQRSPNWNEFRLNLGLRDQAAAAGADRTPPAAIKTIDPNTVAVQTASGQVNIPKQDPSGAKFEPAKPATQIAGIEIKSGEAMTTAMLNKLSAQGILPEARVGQTADASTNLFVDRAGKIVGGYTNNADGTSQNFVSRDDLSKQLADMGKNIDSMENGIRMARGINQDGVKLAATNAPPPAVDPLTKPNNLALNAVPPSTGMG
ncbi:MAG: hypothetical protein DI586_05660 [Micavibrio aeruginosavorus]|uniref:Uncharacterized protein n=1 Tax=Micavibrio aeruginosavorus TaxID=349221 RepID=A0A2W5FIW4_9BACT|nr:MAG: hypothetical protein DI586_05660 [Micavibrio aeruginosavorus]